MERRHLDRRIRLAGDRHVEGAGNTAARDDDRSELRALHYGVVVVDREAARGHAFALGRVTFETSDVEYRLNIAREVHNRRHAGDGFDLAGCTACR